MSRMIHTRLAAFVAGLTLSIGAMAASGPAAPAPGVAPAPVGAETQSTSAAYGDWVLRCSNTGEGAQSQHVCEVVLSFPIKGQQGLYAQLAIGRIGGPKEPLHVTFLMVPNIALPSSVKLSLDEKDPQPIELAWRFCVPGGCTAEAQLKDDELKRWKTQTGNGSLQFKEAAGREVTLPLSFHGLSQALDGLAKAP